SGFTQPGPSLVVRSLGVLLVGTAEAWLAYEYHIRGTDWHFVLHTLLGLGAGFTAAALLGTRNVARWALLGQVVSVTPDVIFITLGIPHERWMDIFLAHITIHVVAAPLAVAATLFLVAGWGWWISAWTSARLSGALLALAGVVVVGVALALHHPIPTQLSDYQQLAGQGVGAVGRLAGWCQ
ncbi:MAG: hypothetical protein ACYDB7_04725, partial [Mycobacteriales bacterium]